MTDLLLQIDPTIDIWSKVADQVFSLVLMCVAIYWFSRQYNKQSQKIIDLRDKIEQNQKEYQQRIENLQREMLNIQIEEKNKLINVLQENTQAFKEIPILVDKIINIIKP